MKFSRWNVTGKIIATIAFTCITLALFIIVITPPSMGYEISIYNAYPWYFWLFMITSIFLGQVIVLKDIFFQSANENHRLWILGFIAIAMPIVMLLFMSYIRGYFTYGRGDHLTHIGIVKDIIQMGNIGNDNFYPNLHILTVVLKQMCGCDVVSIVNFISRFFFFLFPISMYLFFRIIFKKKSEMKLALVIASSFLFFGSSGTYLAQHHQSFLIAPFILYLYFRRGDLKNSAAFSLFFIIFITSCTFYHPLNSLLLILIYLVLAVTLYLYPKIGGDYGINSSMSSIKEKSFNVISISVLIFFAWYFSFSFIIGSFQRVFSSIFYHTGKSFIETQAAAVSSYNPQILDIIELAAYRYGAFLIICLVSIFSMSYIFIKWRRNKQRFKLRFCFLFSGLNILMLGILSAGAFFANFIVGSERFSRWAILFSFILISLVLYAILSDSKCGNGVFKFHNRSFKIAIVCIFLVSILFLSTFTFYSSPKTRDANSQVTTMEWEGMKWILDHRNKQNLIDELGLSQWRFSDAMYGWKENWIEMRRNDIIPPDHFGYNNSISLGNYYNESRYMIITCLGKIFYPEVYPDYQGKWRFNPMDFDRLQGDDTVVRSYVNGDFEAFLIRPNEM